jgi:AmmeMemoRadiSam system radical SAM enzyme/AmmeMemoRadiSam system protein A
MHDTAAAAEDARRWNNITMSRTVLNPPENGLRSDGTWRGGWWHDDPGSARIICDLCPRECALKPGDRGFCFVRQNVDGEIVLTTYGRSTGFCIDPIEKKPLNHFYPGTSVLSFGTAGCNLGCKFCQNWDISKSREIERLSELAMPAAVAQAALDHGCRSVAYTYNDPVIWAEYAIDTARACRAVGVKNVAVTAGYVSPSARASFFEPMDAANVDLKGFTEEFYYRVTYSHLQPVLDTLEWLKRETSVWFEITNLVIPQTNDNPDDLRRMCDWILAHVGDDVPVHFSAFHPDFRMQDLPNTPLETLLQAYEIARRVGLRYVYVGNVNDVQHQSTYCHACLGLLIERNWYALGAWNIRRGACGHCGVPVAGHFADRPGDWGRKRQPIRIASYAQAHPLVALQTAPPGNPRSEAGSEPKGSSMNPATAQGPVRERPELTSAQQQAIQLAANELVAAPICARPVRLADPTLSGAAGLTVMGAFVTLKRRGHLRACCGSLGKPMSLLDALRQSAQRTATEDVRLPPISRTELPYLDLDVSLLYGFEPLRARGRQRIAEVVPGRHGLQIRRGDAGGLLLPSVAIEQQWDAETFLRQVCKKAGLPTTAWEEDDTQVLTFE